MRSILVSFLLVAPDIDETRCAGEEKAIADPSTTPSTWCMGYRSTLPPSKRLQLLDVVTSIICHSAGTWDVGRGHEPALVRNPACW